ncbi:MAG TPA: oligosaccharide flippase family protein [Ignavibacteria bacterium]
MLNRTDKINALWNGMTFTLISLLSFVNFTLNYNSFPNSEFGLFILINSIFGIGYALDFGFGVSTIKLISEARKNNDPKLVNSIFISFFGFFIMISTILVGVYVFYYFLFFSKTDFFLNNDRDKTNIIYVLLTVSFFLKYISNFVTKIFEGYAQFVLLGKINLVLAFSYFFSVVAIFTFKLNITYLALFMFINSFLTLSTLFTISLLKLPELQFKLSFFSFRILKKYAAYSINLQLSFLIGSFVDPVIKFLSGNFLGLNYVTFYETAKKIIDLSNGLIFSIQKGLINKLSENNAVGKLKEYINNEIFVYSKMSNYYSILIYGILNPLIFIFTFVWFKSFESAVIMLILFLPYSLINFGGCLYTVLMVEGKGVKLLIIQTLNLILISSSLYLSLSMVKSYVGLAGYYVATILSIIIILIIFVKQYEFRIKPFFSKVKMNKLFLLNIILIMEVFAILSFQNYFIYILSGFFILYCILFYNFISYFYLMIINRVKTFLIKD